MGVIEGNNMLLTLFVVSQLILIVFLIAHDWFNLVPFNDLAALHSNGSKKMVISTLTNCTLFTCALLGTLYFRMNALPLWFSCFLLITYGLPLVGGFMVWYRPLLLGGQPFNKEHFQKMYAHTHHLIPGTSEDVRPNTIRLVIHFFIVLSAALACFYVAR